MIWIINNVVIIVIVGVSFLVIIVRLGKGYLKFGWGNLVWKLNNLIKK